MSAISSFWFPTLSPDERQILSRLSQPELINKPDVVLVGTGLWQLATACFAAEKGLRVQIVEEWPHPQFLQPASLGEVLPNMAGLKFGEKFFELAQTSRDLWAKLAMRPGFEFDWKVTGALILDSEYLQPDPQSAMHRALQMGLSLRDVDAEQIALLEPSLAPIPRGGLQGPSEGVLNPARAGISFLRNLLRLGGKVCLGQAWTLHGNTIEVAGGKLTPRVILSAKTGPLKNHSFPDGRACAATGPVPPLLQRTLIQQGFVIRQLKSGELLIAGELVENFPEWTAKAHAALREIVPGHQIPAFLKTWKEMSAIHHSQAVSWESPVDKQPLTTILLAGSCETLLAPLLGQQLATWLSQGTIPELLSLSWGK